jgi:hypothetical protein
MTDQPNPAAQPPNKDLVRTIGIIVVGLAAAVLSFQTWVLVAQSVGFTAHWAVTLWPNGPHLAFWIAWLYPVAIDCFAMLVTREWMRSLPNSSLRAWARANSIGAILLSYGGQAAYHAFEGSRPPVLFVIFMGGMPPLVVGLVVHLYTKAGRVEAQPNARPKRAAQPKPSPTGHAGPPSPPPTAQPNPPIGADAQPPSAPAQPITAAGPAQRPRAARRLHVVGGIVGEMAQAIADEYPDHIPSRGKVKERFGWKSNAQTDQAIQLVRDQRAGRPPAAQVDDDQERPLAAAR